MNIPSIGNVNIQGRCSIIRVGTTAGLVAVKVEKVTAGRKSWSEVVARSVDHRTQIMGLLPWRIPMAAMRDPDVQFSKGPSSIGAVVKTQPVARDGRMLIVDPRVNQWTEVHRSRPDREVLLR